MLPKALFSINKPLFNSKVEHSPFIFILIVEEFVFSQVKLTFCVLVIPCTVYSPLPSSLNFHVDSK